AGRAGLNVAQRDTERLTAAAGPGVRQQSRFRAFHACPGSRVERAIVLAADVEDDADARFRNVVRRANGSTARDAYRRTCRRRQCESDNGDSHATRPSTIGLTTGWVDVSRMALA